jgi:flagellar assembly factor FliW
MAKKTGFQIPEPQGVSRIIEYLKEENWETLREFLAAFVIVSPFLERPDVQKKIQNVLRKKLVLDERRKIRDELVMLLSSRQR